ncbi:MAG: Gldg family protein [Planctomycetaceae bacterium]
MIRANVILAVTKRNFNSYFSGILGYLFIVVFCVAAAAMAFNTQFFAANQANLDQLSGQFHYLLLFLIPAITMTTWADERKLGTDELLFTLPATEVEILLGKYLAVLAVYSVALLFSLVNVIILAFLGAPDVGLIFSTYVGYWLAGAALLSVGMLASALTGNATVAFVLGVVFCCIPIFVGGLAGLIELILEPFGYAGQLYTLRTATEELSLREQLRDFSLGVLPLSSIFYFVLLTALMLYLNLVVISKRRWATSNRSSMSMHYGVRAVCLAVTFVSLMSLANAWPKRADLTAENLFSLSDATYDTISGIPEGHQIVIQSFISPEVPREYNDTRRQLLGLLREYDLRGGSRIEWRNITVEPFSEEAEQARAFGIEPARIQYEQDGKVEEAEVFMGVVVQSTTDNVEIPFFDRGLPIEYELTRSLRTASQDSRKTIGILQTDANVMSGGFGQGGDWEIVTELRKQYKVINVNPSRKILADKKSSEDDKEASDDNGETEDATEDFDLLLAVMPSSLTQPELDNFMEYVESGKPTLIFDDPFPAFNPQLCPRQPKPMPGGPMAGMFGGGQRPDPKGDNGALTSLMSLLNLEWDNGEIVFEQINPHSEFSYLRPEVFFVSRSANPAAFGDSPITSGLQDVVCIFSGKVNGNDKDRDSGRLKSLLQTSANSGRLEWEKYTDASMSFMGGGVRLQENPLRLTDKYAHDIAVSVQSDDKDNPLNVVFCADADLISDQFFSLRRRQVLDVEFDNVTFVLNAVDALVGDEEFINLRSRRSKLRTLEYVESQSRDLRKKLSDEEKDAEAQTDANLKAATEELQKAVTELKQRDDIDLASKQQLLAAKEEQVNKRINAEQRELEREKEKRVREAALNMKRDVRRIENQVQFFAWIIPAILPICFGLLLLGLRNISEQQSIVPERRR